MTAIVDRVRRARAHIVEVQARRKRTKSWMGRGPSPDEELADAVADLNDGMDALMPLLEARRAAGDTVFFGVVDRVADGQAAITEWAVWRTDAEYTAHAGVYIGTVWCFDVAKFHDVVRRHELAVGEANLAVASDLRVFAAADGRLVDVW